MRKVALLFVLALIFAPQSRAQEKSPLRLLQTISVPGVTRKWDHFGVDLKGQRLFVTSEEDPAVEVFDRINTYALSPISRSLITFLFFRK